MGRSQRPKDLLHISWNYASIDDNINESWIAWKDFLLAATDDCIPRVNAKKKPDTPWISKELMDYAEKKGCAQKSKTNRKNLGLEIL